MEEIINKFTPGNYFLTKSMEFTRDTSSGTLWYFKKYIVLYNYIFLNLAVDTIDGINNIINIFDNYINSMPEECKEDARKFFYPTEVSLKDNYNTYNHFKGNKVFQNRQEELNYINNVKKYYFVYLMQIGGQSGVKKHIRDHLYKADFTFDKLDEIINEYLVENPGNNYGIGGIKSDYHASLRNERQILWYYGIVHSKSNGANDIEFCSLTPIGEMLVHANYNEFRLIWEHQKLKMISQPINVEINNLNNVDSNLFKINMNPYVTILEILNIKGAFSKDEYQYIISRTNEENVNTIIEKFDIFKNNIDVIKRKVESWGRNSDVAPEDFGKELKKYLLGIRSDLTKDYGTNNFGLCSYGNSISISNDVVLDKVYLIYKQIGKYKKNKNLDLFIDCENELKKKYNDNNYNIDRKSRINWDLYLMHIDTNIMTALIILDYMLENHKEINEVSINRDFLRMIKERFSLLLKCFNNGKKIDEQFILIRDLLESNRFESINDNISYIPDTITYVRDINTSDLEEKIDNISNQGNYQIENRTRNMTLIALIKFLYQAKYIDSNKLIKCDCCGNYTFLTSRNEAYLEYHHLLPFSIVDGPDHYINIVGICPDCHRKMHFANEALKTELYSDFDKNNHLKQKIYERLVFLYKKHLLKSYQLEYAYTEKMINDEQYDSIMTM